MGNDIAEWYDSLSGKWGGHYRSCDKHFVQRVRNVFLLIDFLPDASKVLDIGCASGEITALVSKKYGCDVIGIDISERMIASSKKDYESDKIHFKKGDILNLPFQSGQFDLVLSLSVIEWLANYEKAIIEVSRVLKTGGQWIVSIPNWRAPLRKLELLKSFISKGSYIRYQQNRITISEFRRIAFSYNFSIAKSIFHVLPGYSSNLPERIGAQFGMMCIMSLRKSP